MLCDLHLYRLYEDYTTKKKAPIDVGDILGISLSNGADQAVVVHCAVRHLILTKFTLSLSQIAKLPKFFKCNNLALPPSSFLPIYSLSLVTVYSMWRMAAQLLN